jgi:hypothetical protein
MPFADEIILGARQLPNPEGIAPRMDTEGPPPTRMPQGAKLQLIPDATEAQRHIENVDPAHTMEQPGMVREASAHSAPPEGNMVMQDAGAQPAPDTSALPAHEGSVPHAPTATPELAPLNESGLAGHALQQEGQARHAARMREFGDAEAKVNSALMKGPDEFQNPNDYTRYLQTVHAHQGALRAAKAEYEQAHPWGSMESAHPGVFGKIGHAFGQIANVAGEALAPGLTQAIPGSHMNLEREKALGEQEIGQAVKEGAAADTADLKAAQEGLATAKTATEPTKAAKNVADTAKTQAQTDVIEQVGGKKFMKMPDNSIAEVTPNPDGSSSAKIIYKGDPKLRTSFQKGIMINGKPHDVLANAETGAMIHDLGETQVPAGADKGITMIVPNAQGTGDVMRVAPGAKNIPLGAQTPSGFAELGRPTQQQRNAAGRATQAVENIPRIQADLTRLQDQLGPIYGRWNEFMQGKVGMENPEFAGLHQDLMMLSSAVALAHAVGRLPENLREEFDRAINAPKQDPKNLIAVLNSVDHWMQGMKSSGTDPFTKAAEAATPKATEAPKTGVSFADWQKGRKK